jgi:hypothetical protein
MQVAKAVGSCTRGDRVASLSAVLEMACVAELRRKDQERKNRLQISDKPHVPQGSEETLQTITNNHGEEVIVLD